MPIKITHCPTTVCPQRFEDRCCRVCRLQLYVTVIHILHGVDDRYVCTAVAIQVKLSAAFDDSIGLTDWSVCLCAKCANSEKTPQIRQTFHYVVQHRAQRTVRRTHTTFTNYFMIVYKNLSTMTECLSVWVHHCLDITWTMSPPGRQHRRIDNGDDSFQYCFFFFLLV